MVTVAQGDIWWADLPEPPGSAPGFRRPVLVVQGDALNRSRIATVVCVALTSNLKWATAPGNVALPAGTTGLPKDSVANVSQLVTLDKAEPGLWRKSMTAGEQGVYRISSGKLASVVTVGNANAKELSAVTATDAALSPLLNETGGGSFWLGRNQADSSPLPKITPI